MWLHRWCRGIGFGSACMLIFAFVLLGAARGSFLFEDQDTVFFDPPTLQDLTPALQEALAVLNKGDFVEAERRARGVLARDPGSAPAHEILGAALALQNRLPEAITALNQAVELSPGQATALTKLGDIAVALGQNAIARDYFERAIAAAPHETRAHQRLGVFHEQEGYVDSAIHHFEKGLRGTPETYLGVKFNLARLYVMTGSFDSAIDLLEPWSHEETGNAETFRVVAAAHLGAGRPDEALTLLERALRQQPDDLTLHLEKGDALLAAGRTEDALEVFSSARAQPGAPAAIFVREGDTLVSLGRFEAAESAYRTALAREPRAGAAHHGLGSLYALTRRYDQAVMAYQDGLEHSPESDALLRGLTVAELRRGNTDAALATAQRLMQVSTQSADLFLLASLHEQAGQTRAAEDLYRELVSNDEQFWPAFNNLAMIRLQEGDPEEALAFAKRSYQLAGTRVSNAAHTYGLAQLRSGHAAEARETFERARELEPNHALIRYHLGLTYLELGKDDDARTELQAALDIDPEFRYADEARKFLSQ